MSDNEYIYIVLSATPYKIGRAIRLFVRGTYNHSSIALSPDLTTLYSFARYHKNAPFYAGFVNESCLRYENKGKRAKIKVFKLPITAEQKSAIVKYFDAVYNCEHYQYNLFSAFCAPLHRKLELEYAFTCIEFVVDVLIRFGICNSLDSDTYYTFMDVEKILADYVCYEGEYNFPDNATWGTDTFPNLLTMPNKIHSTLEENALLLRKLAKKSAMLRKIYSWHTKN